LYRESELIMLDDQHRFQPEGFQHNGEVGKRIRGVGGWDKIIPESMAMYALNERPFQLTSQTVPEAKMWVLEGFAGGLQPWWHHVGGQQLDRRMLGTAAPLWRWHRDHEDYLIDREPVANVGVIWSQRNMDFYGRADGKILVDEPWNGWTQALVRARIPYVPVHIDDVGLTTQQIKVLILPAIAAISDAQAEALRTFVRVGGRLLATGPSTLCHEDGTLRKDFALADLFGAHVPEGHVFRNDEKRTEWAKDWSQSYLRINRSRLTDEVSHVLFSQFDNTDILPFGGNLEAVRIDHGAKTPFSFAPAWPTSSVEGAYLHSTAEETPALVLYQPFGDSSRVAYFPADVDRRYAREYLPDLGNLLANAVRWLVEDQLPLRIEGPGLIDAHLYRQSNRVVFHLLNLTSAGTWRAPVEELVPLGPYRISIRLPENFRFERVRSLSGTNDGETVDAKEAEGFVQFTLPTLLDHHVYTIEAKASAPS
ncbi:MAG TPA: Tat pathway signal protein, partial [Opitutaceae bacterium]